MVPLLRGHILDQPEIRDAGIIDQHVQMPAGVMDPVKELPAAVVIPGIPHKGHTFHLVVFDLQHGAQEILLPVDAGDGKVIAHLRKADGDGFPDAAGCAGYKYGFSVCHEIASFL